jgi:hypothetical protein
VTCQIEVQNYLEESGLDWFDDSVIVPRVDKHIVSVIKLTGRVFDRAALCGLMLKLYDLRSYDFPMCDLPTHLMAGIGTLEMFIPNVRRQIQEMFKPGVPFRHRKIVEKADCWRIIYELTRGFQS